MQSCEPKSLTHDIDNMLGADAEDVEELLGRCQLGSLHISDSAASPTPPSLKCSSIAMICHAVGRGIDGE